MSLVTSCPQCASIFVVRPEQLAALQGKVRCGNCQRVFNALDSLQEPVNSVESVESRESIADTVILNEVSTEQLVEAEEPVSPVEYTEIPETSTPAKPVADTPPRLNKVISELLVPIDLSADKAISEPLPSARPDVEVQGKLQQARRHKVNKVSLILLCLMLILITVTQSIYFMRSSITSQWPILKPDFTAACKFLGCTVELASDADLLTVEDSDLHEDAEKPGLIRLNTTLINNAAYRQRYPLLELTLTDANELPVIRRTLTPAEYLPAESDSKNGLAPSEEMHINLALTTNEKSVSGYRVYITY